MKKLAYAVLTTAMAGGLALSSAGVASAGHGYNVTTGNGGCQTTSASAPDNANSGRSADGPERASGNDSALNKGACS